MGHHPPHSRLLTHHIAQTAHFHQQPKLLILSSPTRTPKNYLSPVANYHLKSCFEGALIYSLINLFRIRSNTLLWA